MAMGRSIVAWGSGEIIVEPFSPKKMLLNERSVGGSD